MRYSLASLILISAILYGCYRAPDFEKITESFISQKVNFELLKQMIEEDSIGEKSFSVGKDRIGNYWKFSEGWKLGTIRKQDLTHNHKPNLSFQEVLELYSISPQRYQKYTELFEKTGSERVTLTNYKQTEIHIMIHRSGLAVSGCLTQICLYQDKTIPEDIENPSYFYRYFPLIDGWFIEYTCT